MDVRGFSNQQLTEILLTVDGKGVAVKRAALEELLGRAEQRAKTDLDRNAFFASQGGATD